jgi:tripartite-type tricarboxylate transporter receptor subunit TctC
VARFDPVTDFEPVIPMGYAMSVILVRGSLPVTTLPELVRYAHARPGKLAYASSGAGSANHLDTEVLATLTGMSLLHVPYRGTADGYRALLANDVQLMIGAITSALPPIRSGDARPLAVMARHRSTLLPDVPTLAEVGVGDADVRKWLGVVAPAGTPRAIVARLNETLDGILRTPSMQAWMRDHGFETGGGPPDEFRRILADDTLKWKAIVSRIEHDTR